MSHEPDIRADLPLIEAERGGAVESVHRGRFVLLAPDGSVALSSGDVDEPVFPRSSLKPLQAVAMVEAGYPGRDGALALAAASHSGEEVHVAGARAILAAAGLDESALQCPPALPSEPAALLAWVRAGGDRARICHGCSGKHAAMLATCVANGWPIESYRDPAHPLQRAIRERLATLTGATVAGPVVDGCGAPAFAVSLTGLARAFATIATATEGAAAQVAAAIRAYPRLLGGTGRPVTELMAAVPGLIAKDGAEAVWGAALPDGRAFAAKVTDGGERALGPLLATVLQAWGETGGSAEPVARWAGAPVLGGGVPVGALRATPQLRAVLAG